MSTPPSSQSRDDRTVEIVANYSWGAFAAMVAIPVPGADVAATCGVWAKMVYEIAQVYGYDPSAADCGRLASDLFKSVVLVTAAWFGSAKVLTGVMKFFPGIGTFPAYLIDAAVAAIGSKTITARLGGAAALYYKSGKRLAPDTLAGHVKNVVDQRTLKAALSLIVLGADVGVGDLGDVEDA